MIRDRYWIGLPVWNKLSQIRPFGKPYLPPAESEVAAEGVTEPVPEAPVTSAPEEWTK